MFETTDTKGTILVIEDDPDFSEYLCATLRDVGYQVEAVLDGDRAIERARELTPSAITLDILLPGRTGIALYRQLRKDDRTRKIPVIIITGVGREGKKLEVSRFFHGRSIPDPEGVLQKPVEPERLTSAVDGVVGRAA